MLPVRSASTRWWFPGIAGFFHLWRFGKAANLRILRHGLLYLIDNCRAPLLLLPTAVHLGTRGAISQLLIGVIAIACDTARIVLRIAWPRRWLRLHNLILISEVQVDQLATLAFGWCFLAWAAGRAHWSCELADRVHVKAQSTLCFQVGQEKHLLAILDTWSLLMLSARCHWRALKVDSFRVDRDS